MTVTAPQIGNLTHKLGDGALARSLATDINTSLNAATTIATQATITVGAEVADVRSITIQLRNVNGTNLAARAGVTILVTATAAANSALSDGGSTGLAAGANTILVPLIAKKAFVATSSATGLITLTYTDTGTDPAFLQVILPNGAVATSAAITNA